MEIKSINKLVFKKGWGRKYSYQRQCYWFLFYGSLGMLDFVDCVILKLLQEEFCEVFRFSLGEINRGYSQKLFQYFVFLYQKYY